MPIKTKTAAITRRPDAIVLLRADHAEVSAMFKEYESLAKGEVAALARKRALARKICNALNAHTAIEEEIFYPALRAVLDDDLMLDEAEIEHGSAKDLMAAIEAGDPGDDKFDAKVIVLGEYIHHHVQEEHKEMFPKARKAALDFRALGEQMAERKKQLMRSPKPSHAEEDEVTVTSYVPRGAGA